MSEVKAMRMKWWEEKSDQEKIEALAETVENLANRLYSLQCAFDHMERHQHASDGGVLVPMSDRYAPQGPHNFHGPLNRKPRNQ